MALTDITTRHETKIKDAIVHSGSGDVMDDRIPGRAEDTNVVNTGSPGDAYLLQGMTSLSNPFVPSSVTTTEVPSPPLRADEPAFNFDVYMDAKLKFEYAKAQLQFEKKLKQENSGHRLRQKKLKEELAEVDAAVKLEKLKRKHINSQIQKTTSMPSSLKNPIVVSIM